MTTATNNNHALLAAIATVAAEEAITTAQTREVESQIHRRADRSGAGRLVLKIAKYVEDGDKLLRDYVDARGLTDGAEFITGSYKYIAIVDAAACEAADKALAAQAAEVEAAQAVIASATAEELAEATAEAKSEAWQPSWQPSTYSTWQPSTATSQAESKAVQAVGAGSASNRWDLDF